LRVARPKLAGGPHEAAGNGSPRWMAAGPRLRGCTEPGLQAGSPPTHAAGLRFGSIMERQGHFRGTPAPDGTRCRVRRGRGRWPLALGDRTGSGALVRWCRTIRGRVQREPALPVGVAPAQLRGEKLAARLLTIAKNAVDAEAICVSVDLRQLLATSRATGRARAWLAACWTGSRSFRAIRLNFWAGGGI